MAIDATDGVLVLGRLGNERAGRRAQPIQDAVRISSDLHFCISQEPHEIFVSEEGTAGQGSRFS